MKKSRQILLWVALAVIFIMVVLLAVAVLNRSWQARSVQLLFGAALLIVILLLLLFSLERMNRLRAEEGKQHANEVEERLRLAMQNMTATMWDYDLRSRCIIQAGDSMGKHGFENVVPNVPDSLIECGFVHPDSAEEFRAMYARLFAGEPRAEGVFCVQTADREGWWYEHIQYINLFDASGLPYRAIGLGQDVSDKQALMTAAQTDSLTGLLNHGTTVERIERRLAADDSHSGALFIVDLDHFKQINDMLGHQAGDEILIKIGGIIRETFRADDIVGRIGGDEFMVYLPHITGEDIVRRKATQLVQALQIYCGEADGMNVGLSASIGAAIGRADESFSDLYRRADGALYRAKELGRNRFYLTDGLAAETPEPSGGEAGADGLLSPVQLQTLLEYMDGAVVLIELGETLNLFYRSPGYYKVLHNAGNASGESADDFLMIAEPDDRAELESCLREGAESGEPVDFSYRVLTAEGQQAWRHIRAARIRSEERANPVMIAVVTDITELKKTDAMLDAIVDNSPLGIGVFDMSAGFKPVFVNSVLLRMFHFTREEFFSRAGGNALSMVNEADVPMLKTLIQKTMQSHRAEEVTYRPADRTDIGRRLIRANGLMIPSVSGESLMLVMFMDITDREEGRPEPSAGDTEKD